MAKLDEIIRGLEEERHRLDVAIQALTSMSRADSISPRQTRRRVMSPAARRRIAAAQRARWAKFRTQQKVGTTAPKRRHQMSAAGRARIGAAARARWAKFRKQKAKKK